MKLMVQANMVKVVLSRRNLLSLLHKLSVSDSEATLVKHIGRDTLIVQAEHDESHYAGETPGQMRSDTEAFIRRNDEFSTLVQASFAQCADHDV
jgi:hypothetical protein